MPPYTHLQSTLRNAPRTWLVTGVAGFIGSNLLETLLQLDQRVVGLDNFATGHQRNLDEVRSLVSPAQWARFTFIEGDIRQLDDCRRACAGVDHVLHQAALGSVPRSLADNGVHYDKAPIYQDFRAGDVRHSQADVSKAQRLLGYAPQFDMQAGIDRAMPWYHHAFNASFFV